MFPHFGGLPYRMEGFVAFDGVESNLHNDALGAAASTLTGLANIHLALGGARAEGARAGWVGGHILVVAADFTDEVVEGVLDVDAGLGGGFDELAVELSGQSLTLCCELAIAFTHPCCED